MELIVFYYINKKFIDKIEKNSEQIDQRLQFLPIRHNSYENNSKLYCKT